MKTILNFVQPIIIRPHDTTEITEVVRHQSNIDSSKDNIALVGLLFLIGLVLILGIKVYTSLLK